MRPSATILLAVFVSQVYSAPQFLTFKEGRLGVNFGGYHAGVGLGGILGGGAGGGLFAEAGTPHGQGARAGLGGAVGENGPAGGLYAGATAGGNVKAETGLGGKVASEDVADNGFATAQAGHHHASSGLGGESSITGSSGVVLSGTKTIGGPTTVVKETEVSFVPLNAVEQKKVHTEFNVDSLNEVDSKAEAHINIDTQPQVIVKEFLQQDTVNHYGGHHSKIIDFIRDQLQQISQVYVEPKKQIVEKHIIHTHPHKEHFHNTAYLGGFIGAAAEVPAAPVPIHKTVQPAIEERVDVGVHSAVNSGAVAEAGGNANGGSQVTYTQEVTVSRNPSFFQDIFNIPISALKAVSSFLSNTAGSTNVSVQKSATLHADSDTISPKHASPSSSSSEAQVLIQTPSASQLVDDIFAIPINTLGAVNKFLENNVPARKRVQVAEPESGEPTRVRLGPHARRRANKRVVIVQENVENAN